MFQPFSCLWKSECYLSVCVILPRQVTQPQSTRVNGQILTGRPKDWESDRWFQRLTDSYALSSSRQTEGHTWAACLEIAPTCQLWNILIIWRPITLELSRIEQKVTLHFLRAHRWPCRLDPLSLSLHYLFSHLAHLHSGMDEKASSKHTQSVKHTIKNERIVCSCSPVANLSDDFVGCQMGGKKCGNVVSD